MAHSLAWLRFNRLLTKTTASLATSLPATLWLGGARTHRTTHQSFGLHPDLLSDRHCLVASFRYPQVIREIAGEDPAAFADREIFAPLGITASSWSRSPYDGLPHCGGGLALRPEDLARVGDLMLRHGRWGERQVVPSDWLDSSSVAVSRADPVYYSWFDAGYGSFWWLFPVQRGGQDTGIIAASGSGGQWLFVIPSLDLVVAVAATDGHELDLLYGGILPAILPP